MRRSLGFWPLLATIYFCVSGGPFGLEPVVRAGPGMAILLILLTPVIWSLPAALMAAELSSAMPEEGGYYVWVKRALGQPWGFLCGWWSWIDSWVDVAIYPTLFAAYAAKLLQLFGYSVDIEANPWLKWGVGLILIVPGTVLNIVGTKRTGDSATKLLAAFLIPFAILIGLGFTHVLANPSSVIHPFVAQGQGASDAFSVGLVAVMWNYFGWDTMSTVAAEVENPQKTFPKALLAGVPLVTVSYLLPVVVGVTVLRDLNAWNEGAWVHVGEILGGRWLGVAIAAAGVFASAGLFAASLLAGSRVPFVMAEDRWLPAGLTKLHPRYGTPTTAILVSSIFYTVFSFATFKNLAIVDVILYSAALLLEFVALAVLRRRSPEMPRPYKIPGGWPVIWLILIAPIALILLAVGSRLSEDGATVMWLSLIGLATGPAVWLVGRRLRRFTHL